MKNKDMTAMPLCERAYDDAQPDWGGAPRYKNGMGLTKREMFAIHAMQGLISGIYADGSKFTDGCPSALAKISAKCADALLEELGK